MTKVDTEALKRLISELSEHGRSDDEENLTAILSEMESLRAQVAVLVRAIKGSGLDSRFDSSIGHYVVSLVCADKDRWEETRDAIAEAWRGNIEASASTLLREAARMNEYVKYWEARVDQCAAIEAAFQENTAVFEREFARREAAEARVTELGADMGILRSDYAGVNLDRSRWKQTAKELKARVTALEGQQRTPGSLESCALCERPSIEWSLCKSEENCPIKAARDGAKG